MPEALSYEDIKQLAQLQQAKDPRAAQIFQTLSPEEMTAFAEITHTDQQGGIGRNRITGQELALSAGAGGAGLAGLGAAALPGVAAAALPMAKKALPYAGYAAGETAINYLPIPGPLKTALSTMLGFKAMSKLGMGGGAATAAGEAAGAELSPRKMGGMSDQEVIDAFMAQKPKGTQTMPGSRSNLTQTTAREAIRTGETPIAPGLDLGNRPGRPATFGTPSNNGSGRSFGQSPGEQAGMDALEELSNKTGSNFNNSNNTSALGPNYKDTGRVENPPGVHKATTPDQWKALADEHANRQEDPAVIERLRQRLAGELDKKSTPKTQRRTPKGK